MSARASASGGGTKTSATDVVTEMDTAIREAVRTSLEATIPFPARLGQPQEFADLVAYILGNTYLNGETIRLDGATRLAPK